MTTGGKVIYDIKFKNSLRYYSVGDYYENTQRRMYFTLVPDAGSFVYLISDGRKVCSEEYRRADCQPIQETVEEFEKWLKLFDLWDVYADKWKCKF